MKCRSGSALVETVMAAGLAATLLAVSNSLGTLFLAQGRSVSAARYATQLAASGLPAAAAESEAAAYTERIGIRGASVSVRRFLDLPSASFYRLFAGDVSVAVARPALIGGGAWSWTRTAVLEED